MVLENHDAAILVVSPHSVDLRSVCSAETDIALEGEKRLVPLFWRFVLHRGADSTESLSGFMRQNK
jgi:hypothetical protein